MECSRLRTYTVEDPAHSAVTSTRQHPEIRDIVEEVEPERKHTIQQVKPTQQEPSKKVMCCLFPVLCSETMFVGDALIGFY